MSPQWWPLVKLRRRPPELLEEARKQEAERWRRKAWSGPMTPEEVREFLAAKAAVRRRDEAVRGT